MRKRQGRIVINQPIHVRKHALEYWDYTHRQLNGTESELSNPDVLPYVGEPPKSEQLLAIISVLDEGGEKILSKKQRKAFQLVVREGKTLRQAGKQMGCSYEMVRQFIKSSVINLRKLTLTKMA